MPSKAIVRSMTMLKSTWISGTFSDLKGTNYIYFNFSNHNRMPQIAHIALLVRDYDEAISFYTKKLPFVLIEDTVLTDTKRWVIVAPKNSSGCNLLFAKAASAEQRNRIGNQTGGRVFLFLHTDNFQRDYQELLENEVKIIRPPFNRSVGNRGSIC